MRYQTDFCTKAMLTLIVILVAALAIDPLNNKPATSKPTLLGWFDFNAIEKAR